MNSFIISLLLISGVIVFQFTRQFILRNGKETQKGQWKWGSKVFLTSSTLALTLVLLSACGSGK